MHKKSIWTSSAGMAILAAEFADILVVFLLFEVVGLKEGMLDIFSLSFFIFNYKV